MFNNAFKSEILLSENKKEAGLYVVPASLIDIVKMRYKHPPE
jgi:hypothetical protein